MGNFIVILVVSLVLMLAIRPLVKHHKNKGNGEHGCYGCSCSSTCNKKSCK